MLRLRPKVRTVRFFTTMKRFNDAFHCSLTGLRVPVLRQAFDMATTTTSYERAICPIVGLARLAKTFGSLEFSHSVSHLIILCLRLRSDVADCPAFCTTRHDKSTEKHPRRSSQRTSGMTRTRRRRRVQNKDTFARTYALAC